MTCDPLSDSAYVLGWLLAVGTLTVVFPQIRKLLQTRSHIGISLSNMLCAAFASLLALLNYFCMQYADLKCCGAPFSTRQCLASVQPFIQAGLVYFDFAIGIPLYFMYFDTSGLVEIGRDADQELSKAKRHNAYHVAASAIAVGLVILCSIVGGGFESQQVRSCGITMGILSSVILASHWSLQIWETWVLRTSGNLSLLSLSMVIVGSLLTAYSLSLHGGFIVALSYLVSVVMMCTEVVLGCYFRVTQRGVAFVEPAHPASEPFRLSNVVAECSSLGNDPRRS